VLGHWDQILVVILGANLEDYWPVITVNCHHHHHHCHSSSAYEKLYIRTGGVHREEEEGGESY